MTATTRSNITPTPASGQGGVAPSRVPRRDEIAGATVDVLKSGGASKADLYVVDLGQGPMVVKDFAAKSWWARLLGRFLIHREILARSEGVARELRDEGLQGWTVNLKVRTGEFTTWTRSRTLGAPTRLTEEIQQAALEMFRERIQLGKSGVRLLGVGISNLELVHSERQPGLFPDPERERGERAAVAADAVRHRFGEGAITRATLLKTAEREEPLESSSLPALD